METMENIHGRLKRLISSALAFALFAGLAPNHPVFAAEGSGGWDEGFYSQVRAMVNENWSGDYFSSIVIDVGGETMYVDERPVSVDITRGEGGGIDLPAGDIAGAAGLEISEDAEISLRPEENAAGQSPASRSV